MDVMGITKFDFSQNYDQPITNDKNLWKNSL